MVKQFVEQTKDVEQGKDQQYSSVLFKKMNVAQDVEQPHFVEQPLTVEQPHTVEQPKDVEQRKDQQNWVCALQKNKCLPRCETTTHC